MMSRLCRRALTLTALLGAACSSTGGAPRGEAARMRVTLRDYRGGHRFELVSESHTDRVEYYSETRHDAARKIQTDEVMDALLDELKKDGFRAHGQEGPAPSSGGARITWGFEFEQGPRRGHWVVGQGSALEELKDFGRCRDAFLQLYNVTASYQAIENREGKEIFQKPPQGRT